MNNPPSPPSPPPASTGAIPSSTLVREALVAPDRAALPYLKHLAAECRRLPLRGLDPKASDPLQQGKLGLDAVYIGLDTIARQAAESRRGRHPEEASREDRVIPALAAVAEHSCVVLLGDPGSGKTTFLNHLAFCLAQQHCEPGEQWLDRLPGWPEQHAQLVPVLLTLRRFVAFFEQRRAAKEPVQPAGTEAFWTFLRASLAPLNCAGSVAALEAAAEQGRAMVFLDGLDEVPTAELRAFVRDCALAFARRYPQARLVLACRTIPYQNKKWQLPEVPSFELAPFDQEKVTAFIRAWFQAHHVACCMPAAQAQAKGDKLLGAVSDPERGEMRALAGNPMLLTVMALLQTDKRELPESRAELYKEVIELLLRRWDDTRGDDGTEVPGVPHLLREAGRDLNDLQRVLWRVAWRAQNACRGQATQAVADLPRSVLHKDLIRLHPEADYGWADRLIETIKERSGLLLPTEEDVFRFPHRSFQEYLAAAHLLDDQEDEALEDLPVGALDDRPSPAPEERLRYPQNTVSLVDDTGYWREVIKWTAGQVTHVLNRPNECLTLLNELCPEAAPVGSHPWHRVWLAGEALLEMRLKKAEQTRLGRALIERIRTLLVTLVENPDQPLTPKERAQAGAVLGWLGDPRPGVRLKDGLLDVEDFIPLPPGRFKLGETGEEVVIAQPFWFSRFPVTVAQYQAFVDQGGYGPPEGPKPHWWTDAGWAWRNGQADTTGWYDWLRDQYAKETFPILRPKDYTPAFQTPNHPRVGVTWFEALAYCGWLTGQLRDKGVLGSEQTISLPTEAQWEWAARWSGVTKTADDRSFPWGGPENDASLAQRCNMAKCGIDHTSAVGLFPKGQADCGAMDLAGNVWEWCRTKYERTRDEELEGNDRRVLRGGSWGNAHPAYLSCSFRYYARPESRGENYGFRCVWV